MLYYVSITSPSVTWSGRGSSGQCKMWKSNTLAFSFAWGRCSMAKPRTELQTLLESLFEDEEDEAHVYFQPPSNITMHYPCIVYRRDSSRTLFAGNEKYLHSKRYQVTVI